VSIEGERVMGILKSTSDVKSLKEAAKAAGSICDHLIQLAKPGVNTLHLETLAVEELKRVRSSAPFRQVDNFGFATCISLNEEVVNAGSDFSGAASSPSRKPTSPHLGAN
jgi:methionine aminopeptidase